MSRVVFLDTETTGLNPWHHEVWEVAVISRKVIEHEDQPAQTVDTEHLFHLKPDLSKADPTALRICRYYERTAELDRMPRDAEGNPAPLRGEHAVPGPRWSDPTPVAMTLARLLDGAHIVGAVPSFDTAFLQRFLFKHGQAATWHYHLIDVEALAVGYLTGQAGRSVVDLPWASDDLSDALDVYADPDARHTAIGDARWARDMYDAVMS